MNVLVTGGCGFLGSNVADEFASSGDEVTVLDNLSRAGSLRNLQWLESRQAARTVVGDVRDRDCVSRVIRSAQPDVLVHLAGQVAMTTSIERPRMDFETNVLGTLNVLEAVRTESPDTRVIYSSTNKVYGDLSWVTYEEDATRYVAPEFPRGFDESTPLSFHSPYGCSKGAADQYILDYGRTFGVAGMVFRHSSMFGGRQYATFDQGWVGWFCGQALQQANDPGAAAFTISGTGKQVRDILHADDMRRLYVKAAAAPDSAWGAAYNVGGGMANSLSLLELFEHLEAHLGTELRYEMIPERLGDQRVFVADTGLAEQQLGWQPLVEARDGVLQFLEWLEVEHRGGGASSRA